MVRKTIAPSTLQEYVQNLAKKEKCSFGLIIGQPADEKDYILHFARTSLNTTEQQTNQNISKVSQIPELSVADHAMHTTRMLPGGLYILGLFFITEENIFKPINKKLITILQHVQAQLGNSPWLYGNHANSNERIIVHFNNKGSSFEAHTVNINSGSMHPVNFTFSEKEMQWCQLECKFDFNNLMKPVVKEKNATSLKNQLKTITGSLNTSLKSAVFIFDGQLVNSSDMIDCKHKTRRLSKILHQEDDITEDHKIINVALLLPTTSKIMPEMDITDNAGSIRILGHIASSVWLHPNTTFEVASRAIIEDIVRSFQSRLIMHFDSLTEGEGGFLNDTCSLHEPPRRVQIPLPHGNVSLSDYLFPGEGAQEAQMSFQDVLDVQIATKHAIKDPEGQADLSVYYSEMASRDSNDLPLPSLPTDTNKFMYLLGAGVSIGVLLISLFIHFLREYNIL
ncbi:protein odr-4 homolog [Atheta coriaria]|uniref:protein odr-4 homolog n=1 Tax=Dalotia coriaria TaxID=877792 RepID=UPI0031F47418